MRFWYTYDASSDRKPPITRSVAPAGVIVPPPRSAGAVIDPANTRPPAPSATPSPNAADIDRTQTTSPGRRIAPSTTGASTAASGWSAFTDPHADNPATTNGMARRIGGIVARTRDGGSGRSPRRDVA